MRQFGEHYVRGLGMATRNNGLAYGYSITATASFGVLERTDPPGSLARIFLFVVASGIAFAIVSALVTRGFRQRVEREPPVVVALATAFSVVSTSAAVGIAALVGWGIGGWWPGFSAPYCRPGLTSRSPRSRSRCRAASTRPWVMPRRRSAEPLLEAFAGVSVQRDRRG